MTGRRHRIVIVGAGFAGLSLAKDLARSHFDITVIDRHNYHLFQPLLYQVATAGLSPAEIASPIRNILRDQKNATVILAEVSGVDLARKDVIAEGRRIPYETLVLATGAEHAYFGHDEWEPFAPGLKTIDDATYLRRRILLAFEHAETEPDLAERERLLNFVIVGGGPTGVEMAGAIAELAKRALASDFRTIDPRSARIILVEAGPRLLTPFDPKLSENAKHALEQLGVEVHLNAAVTGCSDEAVAIGEERIETRTIMWAAGVRASPAAHWLGVEADRAGRVKVEPDLTVKGLPDVFVLGDTALVLGDGKPLPGVAPVAKQQGQYLAKLLKARVAGKSLPPFRYRDYGALATIGRKRAIFQRGALKFTGFFAWVLWSTAHIYFLIGFRNRLVVAMSWAWSYVTFQRGTRLITGVSGARPDVTAGGDTSPASHGGDRIKGAA
jgi:NADH dehydrogenase